MKKKIKKRKLRKGKGNSGKKKSSSVTDKMAEEMFVFWTTHNRNVSLTRRQFGIKEGAMTRIKRDNKWEHRYETKILPRIREIFEEKAVEGLSTGLEIIREIRDKVTKRILDTFKDGAKETLPLPTLQELCRIIFTEEYILRGPTPPASFTFNEFGPNMTLVQINSDKSPQQIKERYLELADRLRETADIEERRARLDPDGNLSSQI